MTITGSVKNLDRLMDKLKRIPGALQRPITEEISKAVEAMDNYAKARIQTDAGTGQVYRYNGAPHVASAPGDFPKEMSGDLVAKMGWYVTGLTGVWYSGSEHARPLEFKPPERGGRPVMGPTAQIILPRFNSAVRNAIRSALAQFHD